MDSKPELGMKTMWMVALSLTLAACGGDEDPAPSGGETAANPEPVVEAPEEPAEPEACTVDGEAQPAAEDPSFELRATATGPYTTGERGTFGIQLTPRGEFHVNQDFPMSVRPCAGEGVTLANAELGNEDAAERTERGARFDVPFTPTAAGEHRVSAVVDFAVCTPENCMPEQRTIALLLPVESPAAE
ncbi:MAG: hypothetical protein H6719_01290 [Sandaracinaceae bacterium]|nr:hypothetical protein [Sandaracinaceae bacterium]